MALGPLRPTIFAADLSALAHLLADEAEEGIRGALHVDVHSVYMLDLRILDVIILDCLIHDKGGMQYLQTAASCVGSTSSAAPHWVHTAGTRRARKSSTLLIIQALLLFFQSLRLS